MKPSPSPSQPPASIDRWQDSMINIVYNVCGIFTMPVEMALRPFHGTRYFSPIILFFSAAMMLFIPLFFGIAGAVGRALPFVRVQAQLGLIGMWGVSKLFFLGCVAHGVRKWRLMLHMDREKYSFSEGPPLFFFGWLPNATFWRIRIIYEPLFLAALSIVLPNFFIIDAATGYFLFASALCLVMKNYTAWYLQWQQLREFMDMSFAGPVIARFAENPEADQELETIHLASFPKDLPPDVRNAAISHLVQSFSPEGAEGRP